MKEVDVVLSGSGVKMMVFVGCLQALEDAGYRVKRIAGTSGGSIIGSLYAFGFSPAQIKEIVLGWNYKKWVWRGISLFAPFRMGLLSSKPIQKEMEKLIGKEGFQSARLKMPLVIVASDLSNSRVAYFSTRWSMETTVAKAARISSNVPFAYAYVRNLGHVMVDGGLLNNYPIDVFDDDKRPTIGFLAKKMEKGDVRRKVKGPFSYVMAIFDAVIAAFERKHVDAAHWANTVAMDVGHITGAFNPGITKKQKEELYLFGYEKTCDYLKKHENDKDRKSESE